MTTSPVSEPSSSRSPSPSSSSRWPQVLLERKPRPREGAHEAARRVLERLDDEQSDLGLALQWLAQAVDGVPVEAPAVGTLRAYLRDLEDVHRALGAVLAAAREGATHGAVAPVLAHDTPTVSYLLGLYEWAERLLATFEEFARALRRDEPLWPAFQQRSINRSFSTFDALTQRIHEDLAAARREPGGAHDDAVRALDHRLEELFWAASWLHLSLTRRFGA